MKRKQYYIVWIEGFEYRKGEKIKSLKPYTGSDSGVVYTTKLTDAMRVEKKDIPELIDELRKRGLAEWAIVSNNTFIKTTYTPKGTNYKK